MSLDDMFRGWFGKILLIFISAAVTGTFGVISGVATKIQGHDVALAGIARQVDDLAMEVGRHNADTDVILNRLLTDDQAHGVSIARTEQEIADLEHAPRVIERWAPPPPHTAVPAPAPLPQIGNAIQHFLGIRARGTHRQPHPSGR